MMSGRAEAGLLSAPPDSGIFGSLDPGRLLDSLGEVVIALDAKTTIKALNATACRLLGSEAGRAIGRPLTDFLDPADQESYGRALADLQHKHGSVSVPLRLRISGSDFADHSFSTVTYRDQSGAEPLFVLLARMEVQTGEALTAADNLTTPATGRWSYELSTRLHKWTLSVGGVTEFQPYEQVVEDYGLANVHPDDRDGVRALYLKILSSKEPTSFRCRILTLQGAYRLVESHVAAETGPDGEAIRLTGVTYDIASEVICALQRRFTQLQDLFSEISDFVLHVVEGGRILYVSPSIKRVLGYDPQELAEGDLLRLCHPDDTEEIIRAAGSLQEAGQSVSVRHRMMHRDGNWVWIECMIRSLRMSPDGHFVEATSVCRDITARKRAEDELAAAYARAEAASATKSRFLANMSHELRTPLNAIIGFSDIIRREMFGPVGSERYKEYAQLILESGEHLLDLINDILDMSKIEAGKFDLRLEPIDLHDVIHSSLKLLETRAQQAKLILTAELGEDKPHIQADRRAIKQILLNLLTNSIKFTPPGGVVTTSLQILSDGVALQVRDTGIGIAEKDLSRITLPFEQVTHDPMLAQTGSGLGLALVQSLVTMHMGTLKIDSAQGEGTLITVFLPADPRGRAAA
jgi:PAS domain S-box-containing protein